MKQPALTAAGLALAAGIVSGAVAGDYERWRALGPGGTPATVRGWWTMTRLRMKKRETTGAAPYLAAGGDEWDGGWLSPTVAARNGPRPKIAPYPIPQRPCSQPGDLRARIEVADAFDARVGAAQSGLTYRPSFFETHSPAITLARTTAAHPVASGSRGEIAHIHPSDGSMHMIFSRTDAIAVIEARWGERHSLAGVAVGLPLTYLLVYSPRSHDEALIVAQLLDASIAYMRQEVEPAPM